MEIMASQAELSALRGTHPVPVLFGRPQAARRHARLPAAEMGVGRPAGLLSRGVSAERLLPPVDQGPRDAQLRAGVARGIRPGARSFPAGRSTVWRRRDGHRSRPALAQNQNDDTPERARGLSDLRRNCYFGNCLDVRHRRRFRTIKKLHRGGESMCLRQAAERSRSEQDVSSFRRLQPTPLTNASCARSM